jgi:serine/threonine protein kinase
VQITLVDFGVASSANEPWLTSQGATVGTAAYMSPEQLIDGASSDPAVDLWATAVVAYECLTGRLPFDGPTYGAICVALNEGAYLPPSVLRPELPEEVDAWFFRAFAGQVSDRFANACEMEHAWRHAMTRPRVEPPHKTPPLPRDRRTATTLSRNGALPRSGIKRRSVPPCAVAPRSMVAPPRGPRGVRVVRRSRRHFGARAFAIACLAGAVLGGLVAEVFTPGSAFAARAAEFVPQIHGSR